MIKLQKKAFTLVELIIVITIIAILGTIAFISLQGYVQSARNSKRIGDKNNIKTSLELFSLNSGKYPLPDEGKDILYDGETIRTQGYIGDNVTVNLSKNISKKPTDPFYNTEYVYSVTYSQKEYEIMMIYENLSYNSNLLNVTYAESVTNNIKIEGTYNGVFIKKGKKIIPTPSIINSELHGEGGELNIGTIKSQVVNDGVNIPLIGNKINSKTGGLIFNSFEVYNGELTSSSADNFFLAAYNKIENTYSGSSVEDELSIENFLSQSTDIDKIAYTKSLILNKGLILSSSANNGVTHNTCLSWQNGTFDGVECNLDSLILSDGQTKGTYTSEIIDVNDYVDWENIYFEIIGDITSSGSNIEENTYYTYTGNEQTFVVPDGINSIDIEMRGAGGGGNKDGYKGGSGGYSKGTISTISGESLKIIVGQGGKDSGGENAYMNGGRGDDSTCGGGGGLTGVFNTSVTFANSLIVAGSGGGAGRYQSGFGAVSTLSGPGVGAGNLSGANPYYSFSAGSGAGYYGGGYPSSTGRGGNGGSGYVLGTNATILGGGSGGIPQKPEGSSYIEGFRYGEGGGTYQRGGNGLIVFSYTQPPNSINFFIRSCDDLFCSGESWINLGNESFYDLDLNTSRYFQYKAELSGEVSLKGVDISTSN